MGRFAAPDVPIRVLPRIVFALVSAALVFLSASAQAETWQAPVGGKPISLDGRVLCPGSSLGDFVLEANGQQLRPPTDESTTGHATEVRVAASAMGCAAQATTVTLVATGRLPVFEGPVSLAVDEGRLDLRGRGLRGAVIRWASGDRSGDDRCAASTADDRCSVSVARGLAADPAATSFSWAPAGGRTGDDVVTFDSAGRRVAAAELTLRPSRIVVARLLVPEATVDLAGGSTSRIALVHPEAIAAVDCGAVTCDVDGGSLLIRSITSLGAAVSVRLRLAPRSSCNEETRSRRARVSRYRCSPVR
jgi:hypothetical protein